MHAKCARSTVYHAFWSFSIGASFWLSFSSLINVWWDAFPLQSISKIMLRGIARQNMEFFPLSIATPPPPPTNQIIRYDKEF